MKLKITTRTEGDNLVFVLQGPVDNDSAPHLAETVAASAPEAGPMLVFDLAGVEYVTSAGLGAFVKAMKAHPGRVSLAAPQDYVADTFRLNRLDKLCSICKTVEEAVKA